MKHFFKLLRAWIATALLIFAPPALAAQDTLMGGAGGYAVASGVVNSCWDTTGVNAGTDVIFTNGGCTATLAHTGEDQYFRITPANKSPPTKAYVEVLVVLDPLSGSGNPGSQLGGLVFNYMTNVRMGYDDFSFGNFFDGSAFSNFGTPVYIANLNSSYVTGVTVSMTIDNTDPAHPVETISNDGVTYKTTVATDLHNITVCCGPALTLEFGAAMLVAGTSFTLLTGTAITRTPPAGFTKVP